MPAAPDELATLLAGLDVLSAPDPGTVPVDGTDRLLLAETYDALRDSDPRIVVIDDRVGALTIGALSLADPARTSPVHLLVDQLDDRRALTVNAERLGMAGDVVHHDALGPDLLGGAHTVLLRLPKSLDRLREIAEAVAYHAPQDVTLWAAGPVKHMTRGMNEVLADSFGTVRASLGRFKSRALVASDPLDPARSRSASFPRTERLDELDLTVVAHGGVFAGTRLDIGTRYLLSFLDRMAPDARQAVDVGCGSGILATSLARARPGLTVVASDQSAVAVASATATAHANGLGHAVRAVQDDALDSLPDASADLLVCNPPFHSGTSVRTDAAHRMFAAAARVLRPGGELWTVFNSHLLYTRDLRRVVGPTDMIGQNPKFTVTRSTRRPRA